MNLASGSELWAFDKVEGFVQSKPAVYNGLIVFTAADNAVYALRASDGSLAWKYSVADNGSRVGYAAGSNARQSLVAPVAVSVVASNDKVFFSTPNHSLYALSAADGKLLWKDDSAKYIESLGVSTDNNTLFARSSDGLVFLVDTKAGKPEIIKTIKSCYTQDLNHTAIVPYDKYLLMATNDGMVVAVDPEAGSVAKCIKFDNVAVNTVAVADSRVIATTTNGVVVAIDGIIK